MTVEHGASPVSVRNEVYPLRAWLPKTIVLGTAELFLFLNILWIWRYRVGQALDIDEAGYFATALSDYRAWLLHGFLGWIKEVEAPSIQSPITTALSSVLYMMAGPVSELGYLVPIAFGAGTIILSYLIARRLAGEWFGTLVAVFVATSPAIINFSRNFNFAMAATFFTTLALLCLLLSKGLSSRRWSIALGVSVGLMVLARTMTLAFYPAIGAAVLWAVFTNDRHRKRALLNAVIAGVIAVLTASTWLIFSWERVFGYLFSFGYGAKAKNYGPSAFWESVRITVQYLGIYAQLRHFLWLVLGWMALIASGGYALLHKSRNDLFSRLSSSAIAPIVIFSVLSIAALMSSSNKGSGFSIPLFPAIAIVALYGLYTLFQNRQWQRAVSALVIVSSVAAAFPLMGMGPPFFREANINLPLIHTIPKVASRAPIYGYMLSGQLGSPDVPTVLSADESRQWVAAADQISLILHDMTPPGKVVKFGFRTYVLNGNTVLFANGRRVDTPLPIDQAPPFPGTVEDYRRWIEASPSCSLLSSPSTAGDILPSVDVPALEQAATLSGFSVKQITHMPNGREIRFWSRPCQ